jgi:hypothetical protein
MDPWIRIHTKMSRIRNHYKARKFSSNYRSLTTIPGQQYALFIKKLEKLEFSCKSEEP